MLEENLRLHGLIRKNAARFQWVVIEPRDIASLRQAGGLLCFPKVLGIRLPASTLRQRAAGFADKLLALAVEQGTAVMVQSAHIPEIVPFAEKYASVNVPQLCTQRLDKECLAEHIAQTANLYTDTAGSPAAFSEAFRVAGWQRFNQERDL